MREDAKRFLRQLLMHRYAKLIQAIATTYNLTDEQRQRLEDNLLTVDFMDTAFAKSHSS